MGVLEALKEAVGIKPAASDEVNPEEGTEVVEDPVSAENEWLYESEMQAGGGFRQDEKHRLFWLDVPQLTEFERMNSTMDTDAEFWDWFKTFAKEAKLKPTQRENKRKERGQVQEWTDWGWKGKEKDGSAYMRDMWHGWGYSASSDLTRRLAIALGAVGTTVSAVRTKPGRYRVNLANDSKEAPTSFTSLQDEAITVSPQALLDPAVEETRGIEITTGWALHEAGHSEYTIDVYEGILKPYVLRPAAVSGLLANILEDVRIERLTAEKFPGFAIYFRHSLDYLWSLAKDKHTGVWAAAKLNDKLNFIIATVRWSIEFEPMVVATGKPEDFAEYEWWRGWLDRYETQTVDLRGSVIDALARLAEDEATNKELASQTEKEDKREKAMAKSLEWLGSEEAKKVIGDLIKELEKEGGLSASCPSPAAKEGGEGMVDGPVQRAGLGDDEADEVERLIDQNMEIEEPSPHFADSWDGNVPKNIILRPLESDMSRQAFIKDRNPILQRLRAAFVLRAAAAEYSTRLLKSGQIDEDELWRWGAKDYRVFEQHTVESKPDADITLLVDLSGSMASSYGGGGGKLRIAQSLAQVILMCVKDMQGVTFRVRGHTTGNDETLNDNGIYRIWERGDPETRLGIIQTVVHASNYDGYAIGWCIDELLKLGTLSNQKILIVLSDGLPAGGMGYSGRPAQDHMRSVSDWGERHGVYTVQIAIDPSGIRPVEQARMFKHWIPFTSQEVLPAQLTKLLTKFL